MTRLPCLAFTCAMCLLGGAVATPYAQSPPTAPRRDRVCDRLAKVPIGDVIAMQCVVYGARRKGCQVSTIVPGAHDRVELHTPALNADTNGYAEDPDACADGFLAGLQQSPLREIVASFRLGPAK